MSAIIIIILVIFFGIRLSNMDKLSKNILYFYLGFWGIAIFLSALNLLKFYPVDYSTYLLLLLHLVAFVIGFAVYGISGTQRRIVNVVRLEHQINRFVDNKVFRVLLIVLTLYVLSLFVVYFQKIMLYNNLADIRSQFYDGSEIYGSQFRILNQWLLKPFSIFVTPLFAFLCFKRRDWVCLLLGVFLLVYNSLSAGRFGYVKIAIGFVFVVFCILPRLKKKSRNWIVMLLALVGVYALVMFTTVARLGSFSSASSMSETGSEIMGENAVLSITQPIKGLDYAINNGYVERVGGYQYGELTFTSFEKVINPFFRLIGAGFHISATDLAFKQEEYIDIGYSRKQNALYTSVLWYYLDFGWFGAIIFPFLFGLLIRLSVMQFYKYQTLPLVLLIGYFFQLMLFSLFDFQITSESDLLFIIMFWWWGVLPLFNLQRVPIPIVLYILFALIYTQF